MDPKQIYHQVQQHYGLVAKGEASQYGQTVAKAFGYTEDELVNTPEDAALGLSCGNPLALAKLREVRGFPFQIVPTMLSLASY